jgi:hypothetical protein
MATSMNVNRAISGTYGEVWIDGIKMAEVYGLDAQIEINKADVPMCGYRNGTAQKMAGWTGTGSLRFNKVSSTFLKKQLNSLKEGRQLVCTIISKLADPSVSEYGHERVELKNVTFDSVQLAGWEAGNIVQMEQPFTFDDFNMLDAIND